MTEDDRIDEIIRSAASEYNRPPATPRDEMWAAIQAAHHAPGPRLHVMAGGASPAHAASRRFPPRYSWLGAAAAAVLLVATGIGIGRLSNRTAAPTVRQNPIAIVADAPAPVPVPPNDEIGSRAPATGQAQPPRASSPAPTSRRSADEIRKNPIITSVKKPTPLNPPRYAGTPQEVSNLYQVATIRHLADAEALLTSFTLESRDAATNRNLVDWAKGLLSNTRLLLDSPAGDDPRRAKLLQDLELVLAQIVQLSPGAAATDRELIQGSIQEGHVITRLRTALPAGDAGEILER